MKFFLKGDVAISFDAELGLYSSEGMGFGE
jgi:hypothetical protein